MRRYKISLERYGISKAGFEELRGFCLQYPEKKEKVKDIISIKSPSFSDKSKSGFVSDPTAKKAEEVAEKYQADVDLIEKTAREVDEFLAPWIIKSVTQDIPAWMLILNDGMPATEKVFSLKRRQFYCLLAIRKNIII